MEAEQQKLIQFLVDCGTPLEDVKAILRPWPNGALKKYFCCKEIKDGNNTSEAEEREFDIPGPEES